MGFKIKKEPHKYNEKTITTKFGELESKGMRLN